MAPTATSWPMMAGHGVGCAGHRGDRRARSVREGGCINESTVGTDSGQGVLDGLTAANRVQLGDEESSDRLPSGRGPQNPQGVMLPCQGARACKAVRVVEPRGPNRLLPGFYRAPQFRSKLPWMVADLH
jgi:hypothetical protein